MMLKRKPLIFFTLVFAIFALIAVSEVMAWGWGKPKCPPAVEYCADSCDTCPESPPDLCRAGKALELVPQEINGQFPYRIEFVNADYTKYGCGSLPCLVWGYKGKRIKWPVNQVLFQLPDCCPDCIKVYAVGTLHPFRKKSPQIIAPCEFDPATKLGGSCTDFMLRIPFNFVHPPRKGLFITTSAATTDRVSVLVKSGLFKLACKNPDFPTDECEFRGGIQGPGCAEAAGGVVSQACINWFGDPNKKDDDVSFYVTRRADASQCIESLQACVGSLCETNCVPIDPEALPGEYVSSGLLSGQTCDNEVVNVKSGSPYYLYEVVSGGYVFRGCLDLGAGQWTSTLAPCLE